MPDSATLLSYAPQALILVAAVAAGFVNAIAGGGTFFTYPAFILGGVPPALASASNNVGLWLGNGMAALAYRRELYAMRRHLLFLSVVTVIGSGLGASMILWVGNAGFSRLLPPLVLFATLLFTYAERVREWVVRKAEQSHAGEPRPGGSLRAALGLGVVTVYGGFFGGGLQWQMVGP